MLFDLGQVVGRFFIYFTIERQCFQYFSHGRREKRESGGEREGPAAKTSGGRFTQMENLPSDITETMVSAIRKLKKSHKVMRRADKSR